MSGARTPLQHEIWHVQLDPVKGRELMKTRPVVVVSASIIERHALRIVVPLTTAQPKHAKVKWMVPVPKSTKNGLDNDSTADPHQIRTLDWEERFIEYVGMLEHDRFLEIVNGLMCCFGLPVRVATKAASE